MAIEIELQGTLEKESEQEGFSGFLVSLCEEKKIKAEDYGTSVLLDICPEGSVVCSYTGCFISIVAQTNIAGPGFHAFVVRLFDDIMMESDVHFEVSDPTQYYMNRDFEELKYAYFYPWLKEIGEFALEESKVQQDICVAWPIHYYHPTVKEGYMVTPMGYLAIDDFSNKDMMQIAEKFFVWNEIERDAQYYINCALVILWKECYFTYSEMNDESEKQTHSALDYLEAAYDKEPSIGIPSVYTELCKIVHREPCIEHYVSIDIPNLGYRKEDVFYEIGDWLLPCSGCAEKTFDKSTQTTTFMAPYENADTPWSWMMRVNTYCFEKEAATFSEALLDSSENNFSFEHKGCIGKGVIQESVEYITLLAQVNCEQDTLFMECIMKDKKDITMFQTWCKTLRYVKHIQDKEMN
ncbi:MAG: hypothetical protein RR252_01140 [Longicatena sp.]